GQRVQQDPHDRALDEQDWDAEDQDDEWQPSGPDAHLSQLAGPVKKRQGAKRPNPLQTTWGTAKPSGPHLSAPQRQGAGKRRKKPGSGAAGGGGPRPAGQASGPGGSGRPAGRSGPRKKGPRKPPAS
ncbi:MAG: hypothetical protein ACO3PQ_04760, partial [Burkholderiaceae bacterium]